MIGKLLFNRCYTVKWKKSSVVSDFVVWFLLVTFFRHFSFERAVCWDEITTCSGINSQNRHHIISRYWFMVLVILTGGLKCDKMYSPCRLLFYGSLTILYYLFISLFLFFLFFESEAHLFKILWLLALNWLQWICYQTK